MAVINTTLRGYATFIEAMRATEFRTAFVAVYNLDVEAEEQTGNGAGHYTRFHYTKQQGDVPNLYLRRISNSTTPDGDPAAERHLNDEEVPYGNAALGYIVTADFIAALTMPYCVGGNMGPGLKRSFDIILLCTVEAARSEYIYRKVNLMLTGKSISADHLKDVAQIYSHTQEKAGVTTFRPLDLNDYRKLYDDWKKKANVDLKVFREMAL